MKREGEELRLAATDLTTFSACQHATMQNLAVVKGERKRPPLYPDPSAELLRQRGDAHEAAYLATLKEAHKVVEIEKHAPDAVERTLAAMRAGAEVIYQGRLRIGSRWLGVPDFLRRVEAPSNLGAWSYEPWDAKLAREAKANALLQLCFYAELLEHVQGVLPSRMSLVLGDMRIEEFTTRRYAAYFRYLKRCFEAALASPPATYPDPVPLCVVCDYGGECDERRHADDHLSLVAGITGNQRRALDVVSVRTVRQLAQLPLVPPVQDIGSAAFTRIREQARIQIEGRDTGTIRHELLPNVESGRGLSMLPAPSPGDLFIDFEGDPYVLDGGLEYLLGIVELPAGGAGEPTYTGLWSFDRTKERAAFERLIAFINERRAQHPDMHVFHYNHYETTALKRLAGRYATCVDELDALLRGRVFVDLYRAVRQGLRASVESYSLKKIEPLFGFTRAVPLRDANRCLAAFEGWMAVRETEGPPDEVRTAIEGYNRDDCLSAWRLRDWLEEQRIVLERQGVALTRPEPGEEEPSEELAERLARVRACESALLEGVPEDPAEQKEEQNARYVLAHLLEWHRRENKSVWWQYFEYCDMTDDQLREDRTCIGGLTYEGVSRKVARSFVHRYRFPPQDHALDRALEIHDPRTQNPAGKLVSVDDVEGIIELSRGTTSTTPHPTALVPRGIIGVKILEDSLLRIAEHVRDHGLTPASPFSAALSLLQRLPPPTAPEGKTFEDTAIAKVLALQGQVLPVQGPPGTGKTHLGAQMIVALLEAKKRVGITANSHKVIKNLLEKACELARKSGVSLRAVQKGDEDECSTDPFVRGTDDNAEVVRTVRAGEANVVAGTAWLFARADMVDSVDVLFVDEAGQMSLANVLAAAPASNGIVLLGDPQQLDQPQKGVHPPGTATSALGHILGGHATMDAAHGLFIEETWRMHPDVCDFISEVFYDRRLRPRPDLPGMRFDAPAPFGGTGLRFVPVDHRGNQSESVEEAGVVERLVRGIIDSSATWTDRQGKTHRVELKDILIVGPYNAHVGLLRKRLPGANIGTVDKFQGQQAPVVIYTMATSTPADAPRGTEFLYSGNRLNVAISRAHCAAFLVASPALFELRCNSERQMYLVNAFCRYLEKAERITLP
jgi:uncharacterized protein